MPDQYSNGKPKDHPRDNAERGESNLTAREEANMIQRAIKNRWPIPEKYREGIVTRLVKVALDPESGVRAAVAASRVLIQADKLNLDEENKDKPDKLNVTFDTEGLRAIIDEARRDETYVRLERERAIQAYPQSGLNGHNGHARTMGNGKAPESN